MANNFCFHLQEYPASSASEQLISWRYLLQQRLRWRKLGQNQYRKYTGTHSQFTSYTDFCRKLRLKYWSIWNSKWADILMIQEICSGIKLELKTMKFLYLPVTRYLSWSLMQSSSPPVIRELKQSSAKLWRSPKRLPHSDLGTGPAWSSRTEQFLEKRSNSIQLS